MKEFIKDLLILLIIIIGIMNVFGVLRGLSQSSDSEYTILHTYCKEERLIDNNWITGLGYKLTCIRK